MNEHATQTPEQLVTGCQGFVRSLAWKIHQRLPNSVELDDLIAFGQLGLLEAARDFDQKRQVRFTTYAYYRVRGAILDGLSTMNWFTKADYARGRYEQSANAVLSETGEEGEDDAMWFQRTSLSLSMSYLFTHAASDSDSATYEPADRELNPADSVELSDLQQLMNGLVDALPEREQALIRSVYFDGLSIKQAGEQIGISKAWASRLHARILDTLGTQLAETSHVVLPTSELQEHVPQQDNSAESCNLESVDITEKLRI